MAIFRNSILITVVLLIVSCSGQQKVVKNNYEERNIIVGQENNSESSMFTLGYGDEITINVWRNDDLKITLKVDPDGNIYPPLIGKVKASGITVSQLREEITSRLSKYIVEPNVDINVSSIKSQKIHVLGEIISPGTFLLDHKMMVWEAIAGAGGFTDDANELNVLLARNENGTAKITSLNLDIKNSLKKGNLDSFYLKNGDVIYVPPLFIADLEKFMIRLHNIINPFVTIEKGIVLAPETIDALKGKNSEGVTISQ